MNITLQRTAYSDNDTINAAAFNAQSCLSAAMADGQSYLFGLGTVGAPSVGFLGDPDTGLYSPGANQLALVTAGVARLTADAAGLLTVAGALTVAGLLTATGGLTGDVVGGITAPLGTAALPSIDFSGDPDTGLYSPGANQLGLSTAGVARLTIDATGAVTVPGAFTASGGLYGTLTAPLGALATPSLTFSGDTNTGLYSPGADQLALVTAGVARLTVSAAGALAIPGTLGVTGAITATGGVTGAVTGNVTGNVAGTLTAPLGAVATPSLTFSGDTNTGLYSPGADQLALVTAGVARLNVSATGNVGIGVAAPNFPLHLAVTGAVPLGIYAAGGTSLIGQYAAGGTIAAPTALTASYGIGGMQAYGYNGSAYVFGGCVDVLATEAWTSTANGSMLRYRVVAPGTTTVTEAMNVYSYGVRVNGNLVVNNSAGPAGQVRNITISTAAASGGVDGDVWLQYTA